MSSLAVILPDTSLEISMPDLSNATMGATYLLSNSVPPGRDYTEGFPDETPERMAKAYAEMLSGYQISDPASLLKQFDYKSDEMVICKNIDFTSICEHHGLPFLGSADIGYLADGICGLSKMARVVDAYSRRLQVQERLTEEIAKCMMTGMNAKGVGVILTAKHLCMTCRGVRKSDAEMVTSSMLGYFRDKPEVRSEFLTLIGSK